MTRARVAGVQENVVALGVLRVSCVAWFKSGYMHCASLRRL